MSHLVQAGTGRAASGVRFRLAQFIRDFATRLAWWIDPHVYTYRRTGPISREDVEDHYGGVVPEGRYVL